MDALTTEGEGEAEESGEVRDWWRGIWEGKGYMVYDMVYDV